MNETTDCPFCACPDNRVVARNDHAFTIRDAYPVSPGHTLIIPHRHVASFFEATPDEQAAMLSLVNIVKTQIYSYALMPEVLLYRQFGVISQSDACDNTNANVDRFLKVLGDQLKE